MHVQSFGCGRPLSCLAGSPSIRIAFALVLQASSIGIAADRAEVGTRAAQIRVARQRTQQFRDFNATQVAVDNATKIHEEILRVYEHVTGGVWLSSVASMQAHLAGTSISDTKIPDLWLATNPIVVPGVPGAYNPFLGVESTMDGSDTKNRASLNNCGQVQIGVMPPTPNNSGRLVTAVFLPNPYMDASGTLNNVFLKISNLPDISITRDNLAKANVVKGVDAAIKAYMRDINVGFPTDPWALWEHMTSTDPWGPVPTLPEGRTARNPWWGADRAPELAFRQGLEPIYGAGPMDMIGKVGPDNLGQALIGYAHADPWNKNAQLPVIAGAVYLWNQSLDLATGYPSNVFVDYRPLDLNAQTRDDAVKANATGILGKIENGFYQAEEMGIPAQDPYAIWNWITQPVPPFAQPIAPEVMTAINPWAGVFGGHSDQRQAYRQGIVPMQGTDAQAAKMLADNDPTIGRVNIGFFRPFYAEGQAATLATAVRLQGPVASTDPYSSNVFFELRKLDHPMIARDSQAKANATEIMDVLARQYYQAQENGELLASVDDFTTNVIKNPNNESLLSRLNPWRCASGSMMAYNEYAFPLPGPTKDALATLTGPDRLGQVQLAFKPGDPVLGTPAVLASVLWTSMPGQDPNLGKNHAFVQVRVLDSLMANMDQSVKSNAKEIHSDITKRYQSLRASGAIIRTPSEFQEMVLGANPDNTFVPSVWLTPNPWQSASAPAGCNPFVIPEVRPTGKATVAMANPGNVGQIQIGFLPTGPTSGYLLTAVYLWKPFRDVYGRQTHVLLKVSSL